MDKKSLKLGEASWFIGNILCAIGNCLISKSALGLSIFAAPSFIINRKINFISIGVSEYIIQGILLTLCCIIIGKFKGKFIATICNILFYGAIFDVIYYLFSPIQLYSTIGQILGASIGLLLTGLGVALMLRTYIPPSTYEIFVREVAEAKNLNMNKMKLALDLSMLILTFVLMFALLGEFSFEFIGPITVIAPFINSSIIGFFGKILDKYCDFSPAYPKLYKIFNPDQQITK